MLLGLDFDNTIVCYNKVFYHVAREQRLIPGDIEPTKVSVRDYLRNQGREAEWTSLQGLVYGERILDAAPCDGVIEALSFLSGQGIELCIVSHRTRTPILGAPFDLHAAARQWLRDKLFPIAECLNLSEENVYFEDDRSTKIDRIKSLGCAWFIDDLPEVLSSLPDNICKILYAPNQVCGVNAPFHVLGHWMAIKEVDFLRAIN